MADPPRTVALALGSGGARGYAHIGVIQVLEEHGFEIVAVAGSSMGALVGGLCAAGALPEYTEWVTGLSQLDVVRLLDPSVSAAGAIRAEKILARVRDLLAGARIEDLPIHYTAVATDLLARKAVWFQKGPVDSAIRASIAIPGVITPVMLNGRLLADGGIMDPVPIAPTAAVQADLTVAVSLIGESRATVPDAGVDVDTAEERPLDEWVDRFRRSASNLLERDLFRTVLSRLNAVTGERAATAAGERSDDEVIAAVEQVVAGDVDADAVAAAVAGDDRAAPLPAGLGPFDVMNLSLEAMQSVLTRYRLAGQAPDVLVSVPKNSCRSLDFHRADEMIEIGRRLTAEALERAGLTASA